ncbi:hypothetical protein [Acidisoma sp. C75]
MRALLRGQDNLPFVDPFEPRVLPRSGSSWWTLNTREPDGAMRQRPYRLHQMDFVLRHARTNVDTYMSQGLFDAPCRRALHLAWLTHAYVDLDIYKVGAGALNVGAQAIAIRQFCRDEGIPPPSIIVFSGRGLYLKWLWSHPIPRPAAGRALAVNRALVRRLAEWGADPQAVDVSRVLRVVGTVNTKSGEPARLLWQQERNGEILTYDFDAFANEVLPYSLSEIRQFRVASRERKARLHLLSHERAQRAAEARRLGNRRAFCVPDWCWGVLEDIRLLITLRHGGMVPRGDAAGAVGVDLYGHLGACQLAQVFPAHLLWQEIQTWARLILPPDYLDRGELLRHSSSLLTNARRAAARHTVTFNGRTVSPIYTYSASRMIELLQITPHEMRIRPARAVAEGQAAAIA